MIRFIDLRFQGTQHRFAFWDTVVDEFVTIDGEQAWSRWGDLEEAHGREWRPDVPTIDRLRRLCANWVDREPLYSELNFRLDEDVPVEDANAPEA